MKGWLVPLEELILSQSRAFSILTSLNTLGCCTRYASSLCEFKTSNSASAYRHDKIQHYNIVEYNSYQPYLFFSVSRTKSSRISNARKQGIIVVSKLAKLANESISYLTSSNRLFDISVRTLDRQFFSC